jgi:tetratricopeptide (TPR) repeat protein
MTTTLKADVVCGVCGERNPQVHIASTNSFGSPDLDLRPPEMQRSTIVHGVHRCPSCGCCARDLSKVPGSARSLIDSTEYRAQLTHVDFPELANMFACYAMILEAEGDYPGATWARINAAWACDDTRQAEAAIQCRNEAIRLAHIVRERRLNLKDEPDADHAILVDLLRRAGRFDEALDEADAAISSAKEQTVRAVLLYQKGLIAKSDAATHTVADAIDYWLV